ncbi:MAG TPA: hypothetical protein VFR28_00845, partial [Allosphingosinicella sp.]|nr:hypothetical protein [Allosphingosinicella sp.]
HPGALEPGLHRLSAALFRKSLASPLPWLVVLAFALLNEGLDINRDGVFEDWEEGAALHDLWNTMLAPTILFLLVRFAPRLMVGKRALADSDPT